MPTVDASTQTAPLRKKLIKVPAPVSVETQTTQGVEATRRTLSDTTKTKYDQAIKRIKDAGLDMGNDVDDDVSKVIEWIKSKGGESAQKVYLSAIKYELGKLDKPNYFPRQYQKEIDRLYGRQNEKDKGQELSEKQTSNFVPYDELLAVQHRLAAKEDKTDRDWKNLLVASLYTLNPPVRADYGSVRVFNKRRQGRTGNELIWGQKDGAYFVMRDYKTKGTYGSVEIRVSPELAAVIDEWFTHVGKIPKFLLGRAITSNDLLGEIQDAFRSTKKVIGVNLLRHAYIKDRFPGLTTIKQKEELAMMMLHSKEKQEQYNSQNV
jgi:hypothetical protein